MSMSFIEVGEQVGIFFDSFNFLDMGLVPVWIVASIFLARELTEKKDEFILTMIALLMFGGMFFFADDPAKIFIMIVAVVIIILGLFKMLWRKKDESDYNG